MAYKTREEMEKAVEAGQAFLRLEVTKDYEKTWGEWLEQEVNKDRVIDPGMVKAENLQQAYWMIQGQKAMLYDLIEQIKRWREDAVQMPVSDDVEL